MSDQNVCPYCGGEVIAGFVEFRGVQGYQAQCKRCGAKGPVLVVASEIWHIEILESFCHPAHLLSTLHTYDPATHVVVSRETARHAIEALETYISTYYDSDHPQPREGKYLAELRAALEVKP